MIIYIYIMVILNRFFSVCYITKHTNTYYTFLTFKMAATSAYKYVSIATYINKRIGFMYSADADGSGRTRTDADGRGQFFFFFFFFRFFSWHTLIYGGQLERDPESDRLGHPPPPPPRIMIL